LRDVFAHYHRFAETIFDRVFLLAGRDRGFAFDVAGTEDLNAAVAEGRGVLLFGAHFGSFEVLRSIGRRTVRQRAIRVLMHEANARKLNATLGAVSKFASRDVIVLGRPETMLEVRDALGAGEIVGLLADRAVAHDRVGGVRFPGCPRPISAGPVHPGVRAAGPGHLFSAVCDGNGAYRVRFERFAGSRRANAGIDRPAGASSMRPWLEAKCRADPLNWFNFYDFFAPPRA
jgi:predicted LPLAT superfamily acyltransferase